MKSSKKEMEPQSGDRLAVRKTPKQKAPSVDNIDDVRRLVHLLQVNQIELEHQNQELRLTEEELEVSRKKYVNLFDFSPIPYFALNQDGIIKEVNLSAGKLCGFDRIKLVGKRFISFVLPNDKDIFTLFLTALGNSKRKKTCELSILNKDKKSFFVRLESIALDESLDEDQKWLIAVIDLTGYKKA